MLLKQEFVFDSAHRLERYRGKCERLHGHTYRMIVTLEGSPDDEGMIEDFGEVKRVVNEAAVSRLDHAYINEIIPQPTAENIARWAFEQIDCRLRGERYELSSVEVFETARSSAVFTRADSVRTIRAVVFDFDMTLVDTSWAINECTNGLADLLGLRRVTREETLSVIGMTIGDSWRKLWGKYDDAWIEVYRERFRDTELGKFRLFDDTRRALEELKSRGVKLAVASNRTFTRRALEAAGIADLFDAAVGLEDGVRPKPDPEPVLRALSQIGARPCEAAYVGDTDIDMRTARAAGVLAVGKTTGAFSAQDLRREGAEVAVGSLDELIRLPMITQEKGQD